MRHPFERGKVPNTHLTATDETEMRKGGVVVGGGRGARLWQNFICDCGKTTWADASLVRYGNTTTCGHLCPHSGLRKGVRALQNKTYAIYVRGCTCGNRTFQPLPFDDWLPLAEQLCIYCGVKGAKIIHAHKNRQRGHGYDEIYLNGIDHFDPAMTSPLGNSVPCCLPCNHEKNSMTPEEWFQRLNWTRGSSETQRIRRRVMTYLRNQVRG